MGMFEICFMVVEPCFEVSFGHTDVFLSFTVVRCFDGRFVDDGIGSAFTIQRIHILCAVTGRFSQLWGSLMRLLTLFVTMLPKFGVEL